MATPSLQDLRRQIDEIDDAIHDLIMQRADIVVHVAAAKNIGDALPIRPAREAAMLRRLAGRHRGPFPYPSLARMWHEMIAASTMIQSSYSIAVYADETRHALWDLARDQFGSQTPMRAAATPRRAVAQVLAGEADVAVVPMPEAGEADPWWPDLLVSDGPRIVARLPFGGVGCVRGEAVEGLAVARLPFEATGDDRTFFAVETAEPVDRSTLVAAMGPDAGDVVNAWSTGSGPQRHLIEAAGFHGEDAPALVQLAARDGVIAAAIVGVYAVPVAGTARGEDATK